MSATSISSAASTATLSSLGASNAVDRDKDGDAGRPESKSEAAAPPPPPAAAGRGTKVDASA